MQTMRPEVSGASAIAPEADDGTGLPTSGYIAREWDGVIEQFDGPKLPSFVYKAMKEKGLVAYQDAPVVDQGPGPWRIYDDTGRRALDGFLVGFYTYKFKMDEDGMVNRSSDSSFAYLFLDQEGNFWEQIETGHHVYCGSAEELARDISSTAIVGATLDLKNEDNLHCPAILGQLPDYKVAAANPFIGTRKK